jgi:8-oxo-dGTP diphosphatase
MADIVQQIAMKAVIVKNGRVLILREAATYGDGSHRGKYHLPGGRVEKGENIFEALKREVLEETGLEVKIEYPIYVGEWRPIIHSVPHQIIGVFNVCKPRKTRVILSTEHDDYQWVDPANHTIFDILVPDYLAIDRYAEWQGRE